MGGKKIHNCSAIGYGDVNICNNFWNH